MLRLYNDGILGISYLNIDAVYVLDMMASYIKDYIADDGVGGRHKTASLYKTDLANFVDSVNRELDRQNELRFGIPLQTFKNIIEALELWSERYNEHNLGKEVAHLREAIFENSEAMGKLIKYAECMSKELRSRVGYITKKVDWETRSILFDIKSPRGSSIRLTDSVTVFEKDCIVIKLGRETCKTRENDRLLYFINEKTFNEDIVSIIKHIFKEKAEIADKVEGGAEESEESNLDRLKERNKRVSSNIYITNGTIGMRFLGVDTDNNMRGMALTIRSHLNSIKHIEKGSFEENYLLGAGNNLYTYLRINSGKKSIISEETGEEIVKTLSLLGKIFNIPEYLTARDQLSKDKIKVSVLVNFAKALAVKTPSVQFHMRVSNTTNSVYLILDNRNLRGIRISDHLDENKKFGYNIILGGNKYEVINDKEEKRVNKIIYLPMKMGLEQELLNYLSSDIVNQKSIRIANVGSRGLYNKTMYANEKGLADLGYKLIRVKEINGKWVVL